MPYLYQRSRGGGEDGGAGQVTRHLSSCWRSLSGREVGGGQGKRRDGPVSHIPLQNLTAFSHERERNSKGESGLPLT